MAVAIDGRPDASLARDIHVYVLAGADVLRAARAVPPQPADAARAERFRKAEDGERYLARRALARAVAAFHLDAAPADVAFSRSCRICGDRQHGKPTVVLASGAAVDADVSWSSTDGAVTVAFSRSAGVGVDVESSARTGSAAAAVRTYASAAEVELLEAEAEAAPARAAGALRLWCAKEAMAKATGHGLAADLRQIQVPTGGSGWRAASTPYVPVAHVATIPVSPHHVGAVACTFDPGMLHVHAVTSAWWSRGCLA